ncbi:hypothetical protein IT575_02080 [bacterium]|nr:hypothetical protein [bacterium]
MDPCYYFDEQQESAETPQPQGLQPGDWLPFALEGLALVMLFGASVLGLVRDSRQL